MEERYSNPQQLAKSIGGHDEKGHRIESFEDVNAFMERMAQYGPGLIKCTDHAFFRLSEKQRAIYACDELKRFLLHEAPIAVGIQRDGNYAVYYPHEKSRVVRIIADFNAPFINIITFYMLDRAQVPKMV